MAESDKFQRILTMNLNKLAKVAVFIVIAIIFVILFWCETIIFSFLLIISAYIKEKVLPIKKPVIWFVISGLAGSLGESVVLRSLELCKT